jgi:hypothetical protein
MRILLLCHRFPFPPDTGARIRPFHIVRHLHGRGHEVTVGSLVRSAAEFEAGRGIEQYCAKVLWGRVSSGAALARMGLSLLTPSPASMGYFRSPELSRLVREEAAGRPFDLVFVHCSSVAPYVERIRGVPKVLDFCDMDSQKWLAYADWKRFPLSFGYRMEGRKLLRAESALARAFDVSTVATPAEKRTLDGYGTGAKTDWFPNGVDAQRFSPGAEQPEPDLIGFVGKMDYFPNVQAMVEFCARTLPLIRTRRPGARLKIVGADPVPEVKALARIAGVEVTGSVPDVRPHLRRCAVSVAPLSIARGTQNKILESMAMGVPTVASAIAAGGVDAIPGEHLLAADTPEGIADAVVRLLEDPAERKRLSVAGRERMLSHHSWERAMRELDRILEGCVGARETARPAPVG